MNQTGVTSTGSRRHARRNRSFKVGHLTETATCSGHHRPGQRQEIFEIHRLEPDRCAERAQLVLDGVGEEIVAGDDRDRHLDEMRFRYRIRRRNCSPLVIGIRMSRMIASGATLSAISRPASADMAVATSKPSSLRILANVSATDRSSSTMRMVRVAELAGWLSADEITASFSVEKTSTSRRRPGFPSRPVYNCPGLCTGRRSVSVCSAVGRLPPEVQ